jgi:YfiH family protein
VAAVLEHREIFDGCSAVISTSFEEAGFLAAFTQRTGGVSEGTFRSLNLGLATADEPDRVLENRRRVMDAFGLRRVAALRQVHGATVVPVEEGPRWEGFASGGRAVPDGDALTTSSANLGLVALTADCVPVAVADPVTHQLAIVHAGWRGVAAGVVTQALATFPEPARALAAIGPAVGPDHYEVGEDVVFAVSSATVGGAITRTTKGRPRLDLPGTVARILDELGVRRVERSADCTACQPERYFSHRRDGPTGRQALIAARRS